MTVTRYSHAAVVVLLAVSPGCRSAGHADANLQARQRWDRTRGRVMFRLAEQQYKAGLFDDAAQTAIQSIALDPDRADAYALLVQADLELGKLGSAQRTLDAARRAGLRSADLVFLQGVTLEQRGHLKAAADKYAEAGKLDPHNVDFLVAEAESLVALDHPLEARRLLDERRDRLDDDGSIPALAGHIAVLLGDLDGAVDSYRQALATHAGAGTSREPGLDRGSASPGLRGDDRLITAELGRLLVGAGRCDEALAVLGPLVGAREGDDPDPGVRAALATCHLALGDPASAKAVLAPYAPQHPDDARAQLLLAKAAIGTGDMLTALRAVDLVQQLEPDQPELLLVRAVVNWRRGRLAAAAADLYDLLQNNPDDVDAHCLLAEVLHAQQRLDGARTHFERAIKINPKCAWANAGLKSLRRAGPEAAHEGSPKLTSASSAPTADP